VVDAEVGKAVLFAGPLKHAGFPTTKGVRTILVLFLYVEDFHYGPFLSNAVKAANNLQLDLEARAGGAAAATATATATSASAGGTAAGSGCESSSAGDAGAAGKSDCCELLLPSGGKKGGFVVYRQTVDLVNMLDRPIASSNADAAE
jgi:hypothetical protein